MKILSRDFTVREKILLGVLILIIIGFLYYLVVDRPCRNAISRAEIEKQELEIELTAVNQKVQVLSKMQEELDNIEASGNLSVMNSYNNMKAEVKYLNDVLSDAIQYNLMFHDVTKDGNQIRRNVSLSYTADSYEDAKEILKKISESPNRVMIGDVAMQSKDKNLKEDYVSVNMVMTFYETMVGGTTDAGLPAESEE